MRIVIVAERYFDHFGSQAADFREPDERAFIGLAASTASLPPVLEPTQRTFDGVTTPP
jgi:hypothetical protein